MLSVDDLGQDGMAETGGTTMSHPFPKWNARAVCWWLACGEVEGVNGRLHRSSKRCEKVFLRELSASELSEGNNFNYMNINNLYKEPERHKSSQW